MDYRWSIVRADGSLEAELTDAEPNGQGILPYLADAAALQLAPQRDGFPPLVVAIPEGARAVFWRQHFITLDAETHEEVGRSHLTAAGWVRPDGSYATVTVYPDGSLALSSLPPPFEQD